MKYNITIRAEMSFAYEVDAPSPEQAREVAVQDILQGSDGNINAHAYDLFEYAGFDAWTVAEEVEDEQGKIIQVKPWHSWE